MDQTLAQILSHLYQLQTENDQLRQAAEDLRQQLARARSVQPEKVA